MQTAPVRQPSADPALVMPFMHAVREVFRTMVNVEITTGRPHFKSAATPTHGVAGIIGFTGQVTGSVVLSLPDAVALKLVGAFIGSEPPVQSPDFADAVGELVNMVAGSAKARFNSNARISTPSVVVGEYLVAGPASVPCLVIPCQCLHGAFMVEVSIKDVRPVV